RAAIVRDRDPANGLFRADVAAGIRDRSSDFIGPAGAVAIALGQHADLEAVAGHLAWEFAPGSGLVAAAAGERECHAGVAGVVDAGAQEIGGTEADLPVVRWPQRVRLQRRRIDHR